MTGTDTDGLRSRSLALLALCMVAALGLWFSASAVVPSLIVEYGLSPRRASMMTSAVQIGFVVGTLISAVLSLADRLDPRRFFMASALIAAIANGALLLVVPTSDWVVVFRFITGLCMAGIYPVGMKIAVSWSRDDVGLLIGLLVGALTLGSAAPHLFNAFGGVDWHFTIAAASLLALGAAGLVNLVGGWDQNWRPRRPSPRGRPCRPFASQVCAGPTSAIWAICGSCMPCGPGWWCSWTPRSGR